MKNTYKKLLIIICVIITMLLLIIFLYNFFMNKFSLPSKTERINNFITYQGKSELNGDDVAREIQSALAKYTNWDNLFLSDNFKQKFKNKNGIIENINKYSDFICVEDVYDEKENVIVVYANEKEEMFDNDESDNITTKYYFEYVLKDNEIDDLILLDKVDTYTINGELKES